ncbi:hypothetical protein BVX98_01060 [bacterium F11]|nr:hypothetical protein BVX98_01060 [bacterium F11]
MNRKIGKTFWFDLPVEDLTDAMSFYEGLFNWIYVRLKDSPVSDYVMIQVDKELIGGIRQVEQGTRGKHEHLSPIIYFTVEALEPKIKRVKELGGKLVGERTDLGEGRGSYQWFRDRAGNLVAFWAQK